MTIGRKPCQLGQVANRGPGGCEVDEIRREIRPQPQFGDVQQRVQDGGNEIGGFGSIGQRFPSITCGLANDLPIGDASTVEHSGASPAQ